MEPEEEAGAEKLLVLGGAEGRWGAPVEAAAPVFGRAGDGVLPLALAAEALVGSGGAAMSPRAAWSGGSSDPAARPPPKPAGSPASPRIPTCLNQNFSELV